jgi:hypothetical protein
VTSIRYGAITFGRGVVWRSACGERAPPWRIAGGKTFLHGLIDHVFAVLDYAIGLGRLCIINGMATACIAFASRGAGTFHP